MEWLLPSLKNAKLLQPTSTFNNNSLNFGSSSSSSASAAEALPPPPSLSMEPEDDSCRNASNIMNNIITIDDESDDDDDGPPMLDRAVPAAPPPQKRASSIITVPVSKEQFSIIEAHKDAQPKNLLEALQKFNQSRKVSTSSTPMPPTLPTTPLSSLAGSSKSLMNSNQSTQAALARLLPSLLKKPVTPLAALPKKSAAAPPPMMPIFNFKKPIVLRPKSTVVPTANSSEAAASSTSSSSMASSIPSMPSLNPSMPTSSTPKKASSTSESTSTPGSSSIPSFSISIKETMNPLLASLIAAVSKAKLPVNDGSNEMPPILVDFSSAATTTTDDDDVSNEKCVKTSESEDLPPSLQLFGSGNESEEEDEPPKLECEIKEKMAVTRSQKFSSSDSSLRPAAPIRKPPKKRGEPTSAGKSENSPMITDELGFDAPPPLDLYGEKKSQFRASSTSSGISSIGEFHSPPSCSPLAPINGNFSRSKPAAKEPAPAPSTTTTTKAATKRKSKTPPAPPSSKKRPRRNANRKVSEPAANLELQNWIPIGKPWAEMVSIGSSPTKKAVCCFPAVKHKTENITFNILDVISVAAGDSEDGDNIGKIDRIFFDKKLGICANVLWYYKYNQCVLKDEFREEIQQNYNFDSRELIASKHLDTIPCDSIQSHAFVLTFTEYCRYVAETKYDVLPLSVQSRCKELWPRGEDNYPRRRYLPHEDTPQDLVFFCRKYYSINRKAISSGPPQPKATRRSRRHRKQRSITRLLPLEDSDDSENRSQTP